MLITEVDHDEVFTAKNKATGYECVLKPEQYVAEGATVRLGYRPDMMAQFGRRVADVLWTEKHERVSVHVYSAVSVNGHPASQIVSPETDLATVPRKLHNDWILPENPPVPPVRAPIVPSCDP